MKFVKCLANGVVLSFLAASAYALPHYGDENQAYDRIPGTLVTPHIPWARPLAGGPVKALVVIPYNMTRESEELRERREQAVQGRLAVVRRRPAGCLCPDRPGSAICSRLTAYCKGPVCVVQYA